MPLWNMWWPQTIQLRKAMRDHRERHGAVAEDRLAREDRQDVRGDAHGRAGSGCRPRGGRRTRTGAARGAARRRRRAGRSCVPAMRSKSSMPSAAVSTGSASSSRMAVMNSAQIVSGMRNSVMPGARMLMIGRDVVDRAHQRRDAEDDQADAPQVLAPVDAGVGRHSPTAARTTSSRRPRRRPGRRSSTA